MGLLGILVGLAILLPAFTTVRDWVLAIEGSPLVSLAVATNVLAALTGSASGGLTIALDALGQSDGHRGRIRRTASRRFRQVRNERLAMFLKRKDWQPSNCRAGCSNALLEKHREQRTCSVQGLFWRRRRF